MTPRDYLGPPFLHGPYPTIVEEFPGEMEFTRLRMESPSKSRRTTPCTRPIMAVGVLLAAVYYLSPLLMHVRYQPQFPRMPAYCSAPVLPVSTGEEGVLPPGAPGARLRTVVVAIRHGDRSAIFSIPNASGNTRFDCSPPDGDAGRSWARLRNAFNVRSLRGRSPLDRTLRPALNPDGSCASGQLTPVGFTQHLALGRHLSQAFSTLLAEVVAAVDNGSSMEEQLFVRSTDYGRTQMSAAALLSGMLAPEGAFARTVRKRLPLTIWSEEHEERDVLHGVGLSSSSKVKGDGGGERERRGSCAAAAALAKRQLDRWPQDPAAQAQIRSVFGEAAVGMQTTHFADALCQCSPCPTPAHQLPPATTSRHQPPVATTSRH